MIMNAWLKTSGAALLLCIACGGESTDPAESAESEQAETPAAEPAPEPAAQETAQAAAENENEACARAIVVAYAGADYASEDITRSQEEAQARAEEIAERAQNEDFAELARAESDAASSGPRGGLLGTYDRASWPSAHAAIMEPTFALQVGELSPVIEAGYGYVVVQRCAVEKVNTRHILIRYAGAANAPEDIGRSADAARQLAETVRASLTNADADFEAIARVRSEDASAENGGNLGAVGRGLLAPEYEAAAFDLEPGAISDVVETRFGFHVIQRVE